MLPRMGAPVGTQSEQLQIDFHQFADDVVLSLVGEVNLITAPALDEELDRAVALICDGRLVIDMAGMEFIGSAGIGPIARALVRAMGRGVSVVVQNPRQEDRRLFDHLEMPVWDVEVRAPQRQTMPLTRDRSPCEPHPAGSASSGPMWPN